MEAVIRPMTAADIARVAEIAKAGFPLPWSARMFEKELDAPLARYLVLEENGRVVAYGGMWMILGSAEITSISTCPEARKKGYGERLMRALMALAYEELEITEFTLEVRVSNAAARAMYEKLGFVQEGLRKKYYEDNKEDALILWNHDTRGFLPEGVSTNAE